MNLLAKSPLAETPQFCDTLDLGQFVPPLQPYFDDMIGPVERCLMAIMPPAFEAPSQHVCWEQNEAAGFEQEKI